MRFNMFCETISERVAYLTACNVAYDMPSFYRTFIPDGMDVLYPVRDISSVEKNVSQPQKTCRRYATLINNILTTA